MGYIILLVIALITLAAMYLVLAMKARQLRKDFEFLQETTAQEREAFQQSEDRLVVLILDLEDRLANSYTSLKLALEATPGPFNDVQTELGIHGVIYQFRSLEKEASE